MKKNESSENRAILSRERSVRVGIHVKSLYGTIINLFADWDKSLNLEINKARYLNNYGNMTESKILDFPCFNIVFYYIYSL